MTRRVSIAIGALAVLVWTLAPRATPATDQAASTLPAQLTNQEFWALSQESSEPGGFFRAADITNLTSNEVWLQHVIPDLVVENVDGKYVVYLNDRNIPRLRVSQSYHDELMKDTEAGPIAEKTVAGRRAWTPWPGR